LKEVGTMKPIVVKHASVPTNTGNLNKSDEETAFTPKSEGTFFDTDITAENTTAGHKNSSVKKNPKVEFFKRFIFFLGVPKVPSSTKSNASSQKGRISAKRINDIDVGSLTLDDESNRFFNDYVKTAQSVNDLDAQLGIREVCTKTGYPHTGTQSLDDLAVFDHLHDAKAISSDVFKENTK